MDASVINAQASVQKSGHISNRVTVDQKKQNESLKESHNQRLKWDNQQVSHELGQADFMKILTTQLANQDPLKPMDDKEFIGQMAQFSSLNEMKSMSSNMSKLTDLLKNSGQNTMFTGAVSLLGREATVSTTNGEISGSIDQILGNDFPQARIAGKFYDLSDITKVQ